MARKGWLAEKGEECTGPTVKAGRHTSGRIAEALARLRSALAEADVVAAREALIAKPHGIWRLSEDELRFHAAAEEW
jgi:hypothetical protein